MTAYMEAKQRLISARTASGSQLAQRGQAATSLNRTVTTLGDSPATVGTIGAFRGQRAHLFGAGPTTMSRGL